MELSEVDAIVNQTTWLDLIRIKGCEEMKKSKWTDGSSPKRLDMRICAVA